MMSIATVSIDHNSNKRFALFTWSSSLNIVIILQGNYNKKVAPFSYNKATKKTSPVSINVSMSVMDVLKIEEVNHVYTLKFRLLLEW